MSAPKPFVIGIAGGTASGKTTLAQGFVDADRPYLTLDDATVLAAARNDPAAVLRGVPAAVIDEVDEACSRFRTDSDLALVNTNPGRPVLVPPLLIGAVRVALEAAREKTEQWDAEDREWDEKGSSGPA